MGISIVMKQRVAAVRPMNRTFVGATLALLHVWPGAAHAQPPDTAPPRERSFAVRAGWAYGLGAEFEVRPGHWGLGLSGGYVPGLGVGGYAGVQWGANPLGVSGAVAEAGLFRGLRSPLRVAEDGFGVHLLGGYDFAPTPALTLRLVAGGGLPFSTNPHFPSFEFLAKLTVGLAW